MSSAKDFITTPTAPVSEKAKKILDFEVRKMKLFCDTKNVTFFAKNLGHFMLQKGLIFSL